MPPGQLDAEARIRAAIGDPYIAIDGIASREIFTVQGAVFLEIAPRHGLDETAIDQLIVGAENIAVERGWHPPVAA
jgi:hypothetical protein